MAALSANNRYFDSLSDAGVMRGRDGRQSFVLCLLAQLAALWWVLQSFVVKEDLFAGGPDKLFAAIYAINFFVVKLGRANNLVREDFGL